MIDWLLPALGFALTQGALGITTKLALRDVDWPQLLLWTAAAYASIAAALIALAGTALVLEPGVAWAAVAGLCAVGGLVLFFLALGRGAASQVVPVTAGYPLAGVLFAALLLGEELTPQRLGGTVLVVAGIALLSRL